MRKLEPKHWMLIAGFLAATATMLGGLQHWDEAVRPAVIGGFLGQLAVLIGSLFAGAPTDPNLSPENHPGRRNTDR